MSMQLASLPADHAVAVIGRRLFKDAGKALPRVHDASDVEGLHDFRVALRRLRSLLKAYWDEFDGRIDKPLYRRLKSLTSLTNAARDTEVTRAWLLGELPRLGARQRTGVQWWLRRLEVSHAEAYGQLNKRLDAAFRRVARPLDKRLKQLAASPRSPRLFADACAVQLDGLVVQLIEWLDAARQLEDEVALHRARITGKRIRYLLSPLAKEVAACDIAVQEMTRFQDLLGDIHDCFVRAAAIRAVLPQAAGEWSERLWENAMAEQGRLSVAGCEEVYGLLAVGRRNRELSERLFRRLEERYHHERDDFLTIMQRASQALRETGLVAALQRA